MTPQELIALIMAEMPKLLVIIQETLDSVDGVPTPAQAQSIAVHANLLSAQAAAINHHAAFAATAPSVQS